MYYLRSHTPGGLRKEREWRKKHKREEEIGEWRTKEGRKERKEQDPGQRQEKGKRKERKKRKTGWREREREQ